MKTLHVELGDRRYPIHIGPKLLDRSDLLREHLSGRQVLVVSNTTVAPLYLDRVRAALAGLRHEAVILPDGEQHKTLEVLNEVFTALLEHRFDRDCTLVALGGGVIGDMAGLAAACAVAAQPPATSSIVPLQSLSRPSHLSGSGARGWHCSSPPAHFIVPAWQPPTSTRSSTSKSDRDGA